MFATCPRCQSNIDSSQMIGEMAICNCGWSGSLSSSRKKKKFFSLQKKSSFSNRKKISSRSLINAGVIALGLLSFAYGINEWQGHLVPRIVYNIKSSIKMNSASDEFRMAVICHKLGKQDCKVMALARAFQKDSKNPTLVGEYAISLTESKKYDQAILAFQKFYTLDDGTFRHHMSFAESLGQKEYYNDAKEYFYKAIKANPENLEIAERMMEMLTRSHQYGEALSIIGHFNLAMPKTQKTWHNLAIRVKTEYKQYQEKFAIKEMTVSKLGNHFFAPVILNGSLETQIFIVNPDSVFTTVDAAYLKTNGIPHETKGNITVTASNGAQISGTKVVIPSLVFGAFALKNVEAVACDNCAFLAGQSILKQLSIATSKVNNVSVNLLSMKEK